MRDVYRRGHTRRVNGKVVRVRSTGQNRAHRRTGGPRSSAGTVTFFGWGAANAAAQLVPGGGTGRTVVIAGLSGALTFLGWWLWQRRKGGKARREANQVAKGYGQQLLGMQTRTTSYQPAAKTARKPKTPTERQKVTADDLAELRRLRTQMKEHAAQQAAGRRRHIQAEREKAARQRDAVRHRTGGTGHR